jgi:hypothetical protein
LPPSVASLGAILQRIDREPLRDRAAAALADELSIDPSPALIDRIEQVFSSLIQAETVAVVGPSNEVRTRSNRVTPAAIGSGPVTKGSWQL